MFNKNQLTILTQELDSNRIKTREKEISIFHILKDLML